MKRLGRWLFNLAAAVSAILCASCIAVGIGSFFHQGTIKPEISRVGFNIHLMRGTVRVFARKYADMPVAMPSAGIVSVYGSAASIRATPDLDEPPAYSFAGFGFGLGSTEFAFESLLHRRFLVTMQTALAMQDSQIHGVGAVPPPPQIVLSNPPSATPVLPPLRRFDFPIWILAVAASAMPAYWSIRSIKRETRAELGLCPTCGYDLRATPQRCPECGEIPKQTRVAT